MDFTFIPTTGDWIRLLPELVIGAAALLVLLLDLALPARLRPWLAALGLAGVAGAAAAVAYLIAAGDNGPAFYGMISTDLTALFGQAVILAACALALLLSPGYITRLGITQQGEYYALLLLSTAGMLLMAAAANLMTIFVGLELLSLPLYILSAFVFHRFASQEAGMKYFLLSSFASGFLLYGMALVYGATGSTGLADVRAYLDTHAPSLTGGFGPFVYVGFALMAVGFCFKISGVPFHAWTPDVYVGAPTSVTAFMSVGTKVAAFVALARTFTFALYPLHGDWEPIFWAVAVLSMVVGNILAVTQTDVKRMLAYSSVANAGYILIGVAVATMLGLSSMLVYLACYAVMNIGAFGAVLALERREGQGTSLADYAGLGRRRPGLAAALAICLFALAGVPPSAGFVAKWAVFYAAIVGGHLELAIVGVVASMLGMFYYLRVIWQMYFVAPGDVPAAAPVAAGVVVAAPAALATGVPTGGASAPAVALATAPAAAVPFIVAPADEPSPATVPPTVALALAVATMLTLVLGIVPGPLFQFATRAASAFLR
jgi:NADH-quinone oxidoreductase subunit N